MRRYVTTNYYSVRCNCGPFISPAVALSAIYTLVRFYRSTILREGHYFVYYYAFYELRINRRDVRKIIKVSRSETFR